MKKILVIDDDPDLANIIRSVLKYDGYDVSVAYQGDEGIEMARLDRPDLILMDIMLPEMNGAEAVKILKDEPGLHDTPVIFLTGLVSKTDRIDELRIEGHRYHMLAKPFENRRLLGLVKSLLE